MSLDDLRDQILSNFNEERVKVNQRLLIDKILARYSSEFVVYRELMQNSDDAKSSSIQIVFKTENNKVTRILFKNNGFDFRLEDWNRLKTIAEGNPDEQKIGAFGVGFYSLFSFCENPFVSSGGQGMAFYWRDNQLYTKQGPIEDIDKDWTTFLMDTRVPIELPEVEEFARFLANSLVFTVNLQEITVYFNDTMRMQLSKKMQEPKLMVIKSEYDVFSPQKLFHLTSIDVRDVQLSVKYQAEESSMFFRIASGNLDVTVSDTFSVEMERIVKKKPPNRTIIQMIFTGFDEHNLSRDLRKNISPVFNDLIRYPEQGRLYIGFPTHQTTGCCSHLAARVIPTMERESIDLANKILFKYNSEMLCLAGTLCRILYEDEMDQIKQLFNERIRTITKKEDIKSIRELFEKRAAHALTHFTFNQSTPNEQVSKISESQFFNCLKEKLSILSTNGVLPISDVRMPNSEMVDFIKIIPLVPEIILKQCNSFFKKAKNTMKLIIELTYQDVLYELKNRTFSEDELVKLLKWWISYRTNDSKFIKNKNKPIENKNKKKSLSFITVDPTVEFMKFARIDDRPLNTFRYFLNPGIIPPDVEIPDEVLPYTITKNFESQDLKKWFRWSELTLVDWAKFIINKPDLENDPTFAKKVHQILARNLNNTSKDNKEIIRQLFVQKKCIPTISGMKIPNEAYFENVNLFPDLPKIDFEKPLSVRNLMELFGVRKVVELGIIFDRLNDQGDWDHMQLIKYLVSMHDDLKEEEIKILKDKPIWPKEDLTESISNDNNSNEFEKKKQIQRFITRDLYTPKALHREFGLPVISLKGRWSHNTQEGKFLISLGLQEYPELKKILELASPPTDFKIRSEALKYFIDNFEEKYSKDYNPDKVNIAFLPCSDPSIYAKPSECFINPECNLMNFQVIYQDLRFQVEKLGVSRNPDREKLLSRLTQDPPKDENNAKKIFEYLASQQTCFIKSDWEMLSNFKFIPTKSETQPLASPCSCFLTCHDEMLKDFFLYINFGEIANKFLLNCGVKEVPSSIDYAKLLVKSSCKLWNLFGNNVERYLSILKKIAFDLGSEYFSTIDKLKLVAVMENASILVAVKKKRLSNSDVSADNEFNHYCLASAKDIFINDNIIYQQIFNPLTAPEDSLLESLYRKLGCRSLNEVVKETSTPKGIIRETEKSQQLQELIVERSSLFYHNYSQEKIEKDEEWVKNLKVREIDYVETSYTLDDTNRTKNNNTSILQDEMNLGTLFITSNSKLLEISQHLTKCIYKIHDLKDFSYIYLLLSASLLDLKELGYPVDRLLKRPKLQHIVDQMVDNQQDIGITRTSSLQEMQQSFEGYCNVVELESQKTFITFETTQILRNSLQNAINTFYSNSDNIVHCKSNVINNQANISINNVVNNDMDIDDENQMDYCNIIPDHLLYSVRTSQEIKLYLPKGFDQSEFLSQTNTASLNRFINMLKDLADVFRLPPGSIHVFYDNKSNTIAFNRDKILFFNLRFYLGLHGEECKIKPTINAMTYWFMMFCHELSHNFIEQHNFEHEYYSLAFAEIYMLNLLRTLRRREIF
ncbi:hypothetical protein RclHR1_05850004 [Rhizophagus clarus]|uniref:Sacsin/Nov domain-containing protein n=1 Tax=Rhizophagus clarus TaxID=94130 RepID=A0A2Z6S1S2_9GLOM|nr:hypothetical protein RclHR1_05850004 [Rhizophagus clarus]GES74693.1 hypothetical protein GLOIN_2v1459062 [Rhizophagus clarus]